MTDLFGPNVIETASGEPYDYTNPSIDVIRLRDIATALGNHCRFAGQLKEFGLFCSVAEHSVLVSRILRRQGYNEDMQAHGLFHDAHEAWVFDAPRPLKPTLGAAFEDVANRADRTVAAKFGLTAALFHSDAVKLADDIALVHEAQLYMVHGPERWSARPDVPAIPDGLHHHGFQPFQAQRLFMDHAAKLGYTE